MASCSSARSQLKNDRMRRSAAYRRWRAVLDRLARKRIVSRGRGPFRGVGWPPAHLFGRPAGCVCFWLNACTSDGSARQVLVDLLLNDAFDNADENNDTVEGEQSVLRSPE